MSRPRQSHIRAGIFWTLCGVALVLIVLPALDIILSILAHALPVLKPTLLTESTSGTQLGLQNAILGTLALPQSPDDHRRVLAVITYLNSQ